MKQHAEKKRRFLGTPKLVLEKLRDRNFWREFEAEQARTREELALKRKDSVLYLRINSRDLAQLKEMARKSGVKYQTFISTILREVARRGVS